MAVCQVFNKIGSTIRRQTVAQEQKAKKRGSAFIKVFEKNANGDWTHVVLVHNCSKEIAGGSPRNAATGLPGGGVRENEDEYVGAIRELFEETNAILNVARELMKYFTGRECELDYPEYMTDADKERLSAIRRFEKMPEDLDVLTKQIKDLPEESPELKEKVEKRDAIIREYATMAKKLGLIKMVGKPKEEPGHEGGMHYLWVFEVDAEDIVNFHDLSTRNDLAGTVDAVMRVTHEQIEERSHNYKTSFGRHDYIFVSHLKHLGVIPEE